MTLDPRSTVMSEIFAGPGTDSEMVIATIGNQKNPAQIVEIVHLPERGIFVTRGITTHFRIKDIAVPQNLMLTSIQETTGVLSHLLESIATATDLNLPFRYDPEFEVGKSKYRLHDRGDYMMLSRDEHNG
jgi:hypothetical protein